MNRKFPKSKGIYLERHIISSEAYWDLNGASIKVYNIFRLKCVISNKTVSKRKVRDIVNNGDITFTFKEAENNYGLSKSTFLRARDQLIKVGFIEIAEYGGCHHTNKYSISNNWRNYPEKTFERPKSGNLVGTKTRWIKDTAKIDTNHSITTVKSDTNCQ
tara:strand:- start:119 stop:598 length:480 start_codon:yes stop_codon:yes gene_type:complete